MGLAWVLVGLISPHPAAAFKADEHRELSRLALEVALVSLEDQLSPAEASGIRTSFLACDTETRHSAETPRECLDFGRITRAVDFVFHPDNLALDPVACEGATERVVVGTVGRCQRTVTSCHREAVEKLRLHDDLATAALDFTGDRIGQKARAFFTRLMAAHRNLDHFEACAVDNYERLHEKAIEQAGRRDGDPSWWIVPLITEGVALHFLQDAFPPGHVLTPRAHTPDAIARGMHNRANREGRDAEIDLAPLSHLFGPLERVLSTGSGYPSLGLEPVSPELPAAGTYRFRGDGDLSKRTSSPDCCADEVLALALASAASIREVLAAGLSRRAEPTRDPVSLDFTGWAGEVETSGAIDRDTLLRPGVTFGTGDDSAPVPVIEYSAGVAGEQLDRWSARFEVSTVVLAGFDGRIGERLVVSLLGGFPGDGDVDGQDRGVDSGSGSGLRRLSRHGFLVSGDASYERWDDDLEAVGGSLTVWPLIDRLGEHHVNYAAGIMLGARRYLADAFESDRFVWGLKGSLGLGILFLDVGVERAYRLEAETRLDRRITWSGGLRLQLVF